MRTLAGTGHLLRLALRIDRLRLPVWVAVLALMPVGTAAQYQQLYPTDESLRIVSGVVSNPSLVALNGPLFGLSIGSLTAWKIGITELVLVALMSVLTVVRHTRAEEESGRAELLGATVVGRAAPVTAALLTVAIANAAIALLVAATLAGLGLPAAGALATGLAIGAAGLCFGAAAAVAAQFTRSARAATGIGLGVLGAAYLLRALGDTGPVALSWASPVGWALRMRPFAGERWWVLALFALATAACVTAAYVLLGRRDLAAGLLPERPGPAAAAPALAGPFALAWRLHRGILLGWVVAMALAGAVFGGAASSITDNLDANQNLVDMLSRLGGTDGILNGYLAAIFGITGLTVAAYSVQATLRLRAEETGGRLEALLATRTGRSRWLLSHLLIALLGTALLLAVAGAAAGVAYGAQVHDVGGQVPRMLADALVQLPAAWVLAGLGTALFGLAPRLTALTWAALVACVMVLELGALLGLSQWVLDLSPFAHVPHLPGDPFTATPLLWLLAVAAALVAGGLAGFRRRDIG
ncbi:ABC transporter permease [Dactylosporangium sp. AC04546]|uniref:ABC transporter permease n=1 Tax=Dactylosporangium sp. AC04546 TaxID=2862460 RepID=UPI001EDE1BE9|nr:ABC transporter permease [Dactylosporangium sp. AC04546]WVK87516.1 ABC transporter permease [Dactylosporangium sp. AC04546]